MLDPNSLKGARLGVVRNAFGSNSDPDCASVNSVITKALDAAKQAGAVLVDVEIPNFMDHIIDTSLYLTHSRHDINGFWPRVRTCRQVRWKRSRRRASSIRLSICSSTFSMDRRSRRMIPTITASSRRAIVSAARCRDRRQERARCAGLPLRASPAAHKQEVRDGKHRCLTFPTNTLIASQTWMPSICLPAGFNEDGVPVGMESVVLPYHEPDLFRLGYGFEQTTKHRRAPSYL